MLSYQITNLQVTGPKEHLIEPDLSRNRIGEIVLTYIDADFEFWQADESLFREANLNVGALAAQLAYWLKSGLADDFRFNCIDSECQDIFTFHHSGSDFRFLSEWSDFSEVKFIKRTEIAAFIRDFTAEVNIRVRTELGLDADVYLKM